MKKHWVMWMVFASVGTVCAQGTTPDYPVQQDASMSAQIEAVRLNYEDVKAKAERKLAEEQAAKQKAEDERRAREAARAKQAAAQRAAKAKEEAARRAKLEKRADEAAELDLELKRLQVRRETAQTEREVAIAEEEARRAKEAVDAKLGKR